MIVNKYMFNLHIHEALHHIAQAEIWLQKGSRADFMVIKNHIKLAKGRIVMAKIYTGWHPKLCTSKETL